MFRNRQMNSHIWNIRKWVENGGIQRAMQGGGTTRKQFMPYFGDISIMEIRGKRLKSFYLKLEQAPKTVSTSWRTIDRMKFDKGDTEIFLKM